MLKTIHALLRGEEKRVSFIGDHFDKIELTAYRDELSSRIRLRLTTVIDGSKYAITNEYDEVTRPSNIDEEDYLQEIICSMENDLRKKRMADIFSEAAYIPKRTDAWMDEYTHFPPYDEFVIPKSMASTYNFMPPPSPPPEPPKPELSHPAYGMF